MGEFLTIYIVDDDDTLRESLAALLARRGYRVRDFPGAQAFLDATTAEAVGCLVLDLRMPDMNGLDLQDALVQRGYRLPILFLSACGDIPSTVHAVKGGALDFLEKPVAFGTLIERIQQAIAEDRRHSEQRAEGEQIRHRYAQLTRREREIMHLVIAGLTNKEMASEIGISQRTVENHRARTMEKMQAENVASLCRMANLYRLGDEP